MKRSVLRLANASVYKFTAIAHNDGFANEFVNNGQIGRIRMPYGEYAFGDAKCPDGKTRSIIQVWDEASARAIKDGMPNEGYPVYQGHPDVPDVAHKYPNKAAVGWVTGIEVANDAAVLSVDWIENPGMGFKWFSPYWNGEADIEPSAKTAKVHVCSLTSVGLVNNPRIKQFTLANEWSGNQENHNEENQMDITKLAALLGLPTEGLTEEQIVQEIQKLQEAAVAAADNATAQIEAAQAETQAAQQTATEREQERDEARQEFANEREARIQLLLDNAIAGGHITPAGKSAWHDRLQKDIKSGQVALFNERAVKTQAVVTPEGVENHNKGKKLIDFANEIMESSGGKLNFTAAFLKAKAEHPELVK